MGLRSMDIRVKPSSFAHPENMLFVHVWVSESAATHRPGSPAENFRPPSPNLFVSRPPHHFLYRLCLLLLGLLFCGALAALATPTQPYPQPNPSGDEQQMLELINRARANPPAEGIRLATVADPDILNNYAYFKVDTARLVSDFAGYAPTPPLAMNALLMASARRHSLDLAAAGVQQHNGTDGSTFDGRVTAAGYVWRTVTENVYAWVLNPTFAHVGLNSDWGVPKLDHRDNIMNLLPASMGTLKEIGISSVPTGIPGFGPQVVTQDFATPLDPNVAYLVGAVYTDQDGSGSYDSGEGLAGVTVTPDTGAYYAVTPAAGGFTIPLPATGAGTLTVTARGGSLGEAGQTRAVAWAAGTNAKVDFAVAPALPVVSVSTSVRDARAANGTPATFTVTRMGGLGRKLKVIVQYSGTAVMGWDYGSMSQMVKLHPGEASASVQISALSNAPSTGRTVKLQILPGTDYLVSPTARKAKGKVWGR